VCQAPRSESEGLLVEIWEQVLRVSPVGIHDNFFELGGDSILSIQIVALAARRGLRLSPMEIFQRQTIAELAAQSRAEEAVVEAERGMLEGEAPLTPIQRWFFEQELAEAWHFNQAVMLEVKESRRAREWAGLAMELERRHDALRLRYERGGEWRQWYGGQRVAALAV